jgi:uncharacterized protein YndB with AHSA1/START domain
MKWVMIFLGSLAGIVGVAVVVLFALGYRSGANQLNTSIEIDRPPSTVWPWVTEADKQKQWISFLVEVREDVPGAKGVGSRQTWVMQDANRNNKKMEIVGEITASIPGKYVEVKMGSEGMFDGVASYNLVDLGNGRTRLESKGHYHYAQAFARLMEPLIMPQARKKMNSDLARLKTLVEAEPASTSVAGASAK